MRSEADRAPLAQVRRLEERALNAGGVSSSFVYDGWLLGRRPGRSKRLRCVNAFYRSTLPLQEKIAYCTAFYAAAGLPAVFRLLPCSTPPRLDAWLERNGWAAFDRTRVLVSALAGATLPAAPLPAAAQAAVAIVETAEWQRLTASLLSDGSFGLPATAQRSASHPLRQVGAIVRHDGEVAACGLITLDGDHAGLFKVATAPALRGRGLARSVVATLLAEARRLGATTAYLQVVADNAPACALYRRFGFTASHEYWYRARDGERH